jgi:hypothetical protein
MAWTSLIENLDVSGLHHNKYGGFYALRIGLLSAGKGQARFNQFRYKNAVPQEKDMSAYLMVFHKDETHGLYMALSPDGYHFTALNNGKPGTPSLYRKASVIRISSVVPMAAFIWQ